MTARAPSSGADPDERAVRRASRTVGLQLIIALSILALAALGAALAFVLSHIRFAHLVDPDRHEATIDVGGVDLLFGGILIGVGTIIAVGALSWYFTRRAVRPLAAALRLQRAFVANASHELRTPLAVLDVRLQYLQRHLAVDDPSATAVAGLRRDTATLIQVVNDLLAAAEDAPAGDVEPVDLAPALQLAVDSVGLIASDRHIVVQLDHSDPVSTIVPAASVQRCVVALLDNALKFSPRGSTITVSVRSERSNAVVSVVDHGPGIQGIEHARVFDRFARGSGTRVEGSGIGLSLVRDTVERFGGTAEVARSDSDGTEMVLRLPVAGSMRRRRVRA